jgi:carbamate kinase
VRQSDGTLRGVEAVIDKDLTAALLAQAVEADALVIATDVEHVAVGWGTPGERPLGVISPDELERYAAHGEFASGSMGPKVEAALRFVRSGGHRAVITDLHRIADALAGDSGAAGRVGTIIESPDNER